MNPPYWPVPSFETSTEVEEWVDQKAPYKLDTD